MRFSIKLLSLVPFYSCLAHARPQGGSVPVSCTPQTNYTVSNEHDVVGQPFVLPVSCTPSGDKGQTPCTVGISETYTVSTTVTVGVAVALNIDNIVALGASASVSKTVATGVTDSAGIVCEGGLWTCSVLVTPTKVEISGTKTTSYLGSSCPAIQKDPFTVQVPKLGADGNPVIHIAACACPNFPHSADQGAPQECPTSC